MSNFPITLQKDFREFAELLIKYEIDFMVIGGYAMAGHGKIRNTVDIDFWIDNSDDTCARLLKVIDDFGFSSLGFTFDDLKEPGMMLQFGVPPFRIDVITQISGVDFIDCYPRRIYANIHNVLLPVLSIDDMLANKRASNRDKDQLDVKTLLSIKKKNQK